MNQQTDTEFNFLAAISLGLKAEYDSSENYWAGSPFEWIKTKPSRTIGAIGEKLIAAWFCARGYSVERSGDSEADRIIESLRVEIKFSTEWKNGSYLFQQLRDQNYDVAVCLGVQPFVSHCWVIPKADLMREWEYGENVTSQHGGADGTDTAWFRVFPENQDEWIKPFGGTLAEGLKKFAAISGRPPDLIAG